MGTGKENKSEYSEGSKTEQLKRNTIQNRNVLTLWLQIVPILKAQKSEQ